MVVPVDAVFYKEVQRKVTKETSVIVLFVSRIVREEGIVSAK